MSKDAIVSTEMAKKFATEKDTPYLKWVRDQGLDVISAHYVPDLKLVDLKPWGERGGKGVFINHEASQVTNDCYVCEIPPGKVLNPQRQMFEEMVLVLTGRGSTTRARPGAPGRCRTRAWASCPASRTRRQWTPSPAPACMPSTR